MPVKFTDIDVDGVVTVQLPGPGLSQLEYLMNIINEQYEVSLVDMHWIIMPGFIFFGGGGVVAL